MPDNRILSAEELAEIEEWEKNGGAAFYHVHVPALLAHIAAQEERLAEAERDLSISRGIVQVCSLTHMDKFIEYQNQIADLRAELATAQATIAAQDSYAIGLQEKIATANRERDFEWDRSNRLGSLTADLARERSLRQDSEGRISECLMILRRMYHTDTCDEVRSPDSGYVCSCGLMDAIVVLTAEAAPDYGAGDVLAAAERYVTREEHIRATTEFGSSEDEYLKLRESVRAYVARRGGENG